MALYPTGLLDQLYGFDLGNLGAPVEPAVPGNPLPYLIDSEYPVQQGDVLRIPPDVVEAEEVQTATATPETEQLLYQGDGGGDGGFDGFGGLGGFNPADPVNSASSVMQGSPIQAAVDAIGITPGTGLTPATPSLSADDRVAEAQQAGQLAALSGVPSIGYGPEDEDTSPASVGQSPAELSTGALGGVPTPQTAINDAIGEITGNLGNIAGFDAIGGIQSGLGSLGSPGMGVGGGIGGSGINSDVGTAGMGVGGGIGGSNINSNVGPAPQSVSGLEADLSAANANAEASYNSAVAEAEAMNQIANLGVNQRSMEAERNAALGQQMIGQMNTNPNTPAAAQALSALQGLQAEQAEAANNASASARGTAIGSALSGLDVGNPNTAPTTESMASSVAGAPQNSVSLGPAFGAPAGFGSALGGVVGNAGSVEDDALSDAASRAAPGTNPGNVTSFGSRGLGVANAEAAAAQAAQDAAAARSALGEARSMAAGSFGVGDTAAQRGLAGALANNENNTEQSNNAPASAPATGFSPISDLGTDLGLGNLGKNDLSLDSLAPDIGPPQSSNPMGTAEGFVGGMFGNSPGARGAFSNPPMQLDDLVQQELEQGNVSPYSGSNVTPLGSAGYGQPTQSASTNANIAAEIDAINEAGNAYGLDSNVDGSPPDGPNDNAGIGGRGVDGGTIGGPTAASFGDLGGLGNIGDVGATAGIGASGGLGGGVDSNAAAGADDDGDDDSDGVGNASSGVDTEGGVGQGLGGIGTASAEGSPAGVAGSGIGQDSLSGVGTLGGIGEDGYGNDDTGTNDIGMSAGLSDVSAGNASIGTGFSGTTSLGDLGANADLGELGGFGMGGFGDIGGFGSDTDSDGVDGGIGGSDIGSDVGAGSSGGFGDVGGVGGDGTGADDTGDVGGLGGDVGGGVGGADASSGGGDSDGGGVDGGIGGSDIGSDVGAGTSSSGDSDSGNGSSCLLSSHGVESGKMKPIARAKAEAWCKKELHGHFWGEVIRRGYRAVARDLIEQGEADKFYEEFTQVINTHRGLRKDEKSRANWAKRMGEFVERGLLAEEDGFEDF